MTVEEVESRSGQIIARLTCLPEYGRSRCIMFYWSCHNEVHTHELVRRSLKHGKKVLLPKCNTQQGQIFPCEVNDVSRDLEVGPYGICQPCETARRVVDLSEIELCIVPGIAFDQEGNRVGRGLGYYDRFLRKLDHTTQKIGVGYAFQIVNKIDSTDGDTSVDMVVTEQETLVARRR